MTYLEFYQAWVDLVLQNSQIITESDPNFFCRNQLLPIAGVIGMIAMIVQACVCKNIYFSNAVALFVMVGMLYFTYLIWGSISEKFPPECRKSLFIQKSYSRTIYPEKDYTVKEFQENIAKIGQESSTEQIELAKTVLKDCLENLPIDYQVNHSSIVRRCITDAGTKTIFENKDVEIYKNKSINKLN